MPYWNKMKFRQDRPYLPKMSSHLPNKILGEDTGGHKGQNGEEQSHVDSRRQNSNINNSQKRRATWKYLFYVQDLCEVYAAAQIDLYSSSLTFRIPPEIW